MADLSLIQVFGHLLKDPEVDVKIQAVKSLDNFVKIVSPERMSVLVTNVVALGKDPLSIVRCKIFIKFSSYWSCFKSDDKICSKRSTLSNSPTFNQIIIKRR